MDDSNLQRQIVHSTADIGWPKVESARDTLMDINPYLHVELHRDGIKRDNVRWRCVFAR